MECAQIFVIGPQNTKETLSVEEKEGIKDIIERTGIKLFVHGSYLDNPWGSKPGLGKMLIHRELEICNELGAEGLVIHLARKPPEVIADMLPELMKDIKNTKLYLEIESYKPTEGTYETPSKISKLFEQIKIRFGDEWTQIKPKLGLCVDSAHLWAAGVDIQEYSSVSNWLKLVKSDDNIGNIMLHFNDQIWQKGAGRDEHAPLAFGTIWGPYHSEASREIEDSGMVAFLDWLESDNIYGILERKPDKPKINGRPMIDNISSDYTLICQLGYSTI